MMPAQLIFAGAGEVLDIQFARTLHSASILQSALKDRCTSPSTISLDPLMIVSYFCCGQWKYNVVSHGILDGLILRVP